MRWSSLLIVAGAVGFAAGAAQAGFVMLIDDPSTATVDLRIDDGGADDGFANIPGAIGFVGEVGGVRVNAMGRSKDVVGSVSSPELYLDYTGRLVPGSAAGRVDIVLTDTDFQAVEPSGTVSLDGTTGGTVELGVFGNSSNEEFMPEFLIARTAGALTGDFEKSFDVTTESLGGLTIRARIGFDEVAQTGRFRADVALVGQYVLGDVNSDGVVNGLDVDPFVGVLLHGPYQAAADMNQDQVVNGLDVDPFVTAVVGGGGAQAVPEPATLALAAVALLGLATGIPRGRSAERVGWDKRKRSAQA